VATLIPIPKLGQSEETVKIEKWRVKEGDTIKKGDILFEVETDKAVLEVESQFEGTLLKIVIPAGKEVPVMTVAAVLGQPGETIPAIEPPKAVPAATPSQPKAVPSPAVTTAAPAGPAGPAGPAARSTGEVAVPAPPASVPTMPVQAPSTAFRPKPSPRARTYAADFLIDLDRVPGTGGGVGRVTEKDVRAYLESSGYRRKTITPAAFHLAKKEKLNLLDIEGTGDHGRVTLQDVRDAASEKSRTFSGMRRVIAARLAQSKQQIPHFYVTVSVDMTDLGARRKKLKGDGIGLSLNDFVVKAVALSLKEFSALNGTTDGQTYRHFSKVHVGIAVSVENGLVVPVVRNADRKALDEIHAEVSELAVKARDGKLLPDEMRGGTFTISNMGMLGVENFAAIINPGESAILAVSSAIPTPVVVGGAVVIRDMMKITLSADHRIVDGAMGARFVNAVKAKLEDGKLWDSLV
jgi:pyruvate dehydrogenase E2 component (dihydrolipoamide acetyltransferase)